MRITILLLAIGFFISVIALDLRECSEEERCPIDYTCCKLAEGGYGCCPYPNGVCCEGVDDCCPLNTSCGNDHECIENEEFWDN